MANSASHFRPDVASAGRHLADSGFSDAVVLIYPIATLSTEIERQIHEVCEITGMDAYTVRQKLTGASIDVLCVGNDIPRLEGVTRSLLTAGYRAALVNKNELTQDKGYRRAVTAHLESNSTGEDTFFDANNTEVFHWNRSTRLLLVVGSIAPEKYGTSKTLIASLYGASSVSHNLQHNRLTDISKRQPALALLADDDSSPLLIDGAMFNYECLGERKTYSQAQNFLALLDSLQSASSPESVVVDTDFGLKRLPVGRLASNPRSKADTMTLLALYARLVRILGRHGFYNAPSQPSQAATNNRTTPIEPINGAPITPIGAIAPDVSAGPGVGSHRSSLQQTVSAGRSLEATLPPPPPSPQRRFRDILSLPGIVTYLGEFSSLGLTSAFALVTVAVVFTSTSQQSALMFHLFAVILGALYCTIALILMKRKGAISRLATSRIRSMPMGVVEVNGTAMQKYALKAPYSLADCIYYNYRVMERTKQKIASDAGTDAWRVTNHGNSGHVPFYVEDDTGKILVNPKGAVISGAQTNEYTSSFAAMLSGSATQPNRRIIETIIPAGAELYIIGFAKPNSQAPDDRKQAYRRRLKALKSDPVAMAQYDSDGDGSISFDEWAVAKAELDNQLLAEQISADKDNDKVVIERHPGHGVFYISDKKESDILSSYRWKVPLFGAIGFGLLVKGLWELFGK